MPASATTHILRREFSSSRHEFAPSMHTHLPAEVVRAVFKPTVLSADAQGSTKYRFSISNDPGQLLQSMHLRLKTQVATTTGAEYAFTMKPAPGMHAIDQWELTDSSGQLVDKRSGIEQILTSHCFLNRSERAVEFAAASNRLPSNASSFEYMEQDPFPMEPATNNSFGCIRFTQRDLQTDGANMVFQTLTLDTEVYWYGRWDVGNVLPIQHMNNSLTLDVSTINPFYLLDDIRSDKEYVNGLAQNVDVRFVSAELHCKYYKLNPYDFERIFPFEREVTWYAPVWRDAVQNYSATVSEGTISMEMNGISHAITHIAIMVRYQSDLDKNVLHNFVQAIDQVKVRSNSKTFFTPMGYMLGDDVLGRIRHEYLGYPDMDVPDSCRHSIYVIPCGTRAGYADAGYGTLDAEAFNTPLVIDVILKAANQFDHRRASAYGDRQASQATDELNISVKVLTLNTITYQNGRFNKFVET